MSTLGPDHVTIVEVGPRDGLQNETVTLPATTKVELVQRLHGAGLRAIEVGSFVRPDRIPQLADSAEVVPAVVGLADLRSIVLVPNERGLDSALAAGATEVAVFGAVSEAFSRRNINRSVAESLELFDPVIARARREGCRVRGYVSTVLGCPYQGDVPVADVMSYVARLFELGCDEVSLGDTIGVGTPGQVGELVEAVAKATDLHRLAFHGHDTMGMGVANAVAAIGAGVTTIDASVGGLGGCPFAGPGAKGNVATEDVVYALEGSGVRTGVDLAALVDTARWVTDLLGHEPRSALARA